MEEFTPYYFLKPVIEGGGVLFSYFYELRANTCWIETAVSPWLVWLLGLIGHAMPFHATSKESAVWALTLGTALAARCIGVAFHRVL